MHNKSLYQILKKNIVLEAKRERELSDALNKGKSFFLNFNESRLKLAFESFSEDMKQALYEVIYFLHVNDKKYKEHAYNGFEKQVIHGVKQNKKVKKVANLFLENAPYGIVGISQLSSQFKRSFYEYISNVFGVTSLSEKPNSPIYSIASLGSIGTIGHKTLKSDLDLQIQYELEDFLIDEKYFSNDLLKLNFRKLIQFYSHQWMIKNKLTKEQRADQNTRKKALAYGKKIILKKFPLLFPLLNSKDNQDRTIEHLDSPQKRLYLTHEIIDLVKLSQKNVAKKEKLIQEKLLKKRISNIQDYIQNKFPEAEIYLFAYSNDDYREGKHGTTLESKESSGSAYELILNYDVLMPGIQFTPMIPTHFFMPDVINQSKKLYERMIDYLRFGFVSLYQDIRNISVDLGSTPSLNLQYMVQHFGAVYWESFKASSGNLPKALLNLFRIEMLFDKKYPSTIIQIIKNSNILDNYIQSDVNNQEEDEFGLANTNNQSLSLIEICEIESEFENLKKDPWWLRYKALKIAFFNNTELHDSEKEMISRVIDLCFSLHIRISDVFQKVGEKKDFKLYREKVLVSFLEKAYPLFSDRRKFLEHIFIGEVTAINTFEKEMKLLFKSSLQRVFKICENENLESGSNRDEFKIWYHYYEKNFEPENSVVQRNILTHLKVARGRLQIGFEESKWIFKSLQKNSTAGKRFDTFGVLDHLPDEVELFQHHYFLHGIAYCILNGYYGIIKKGVLKGSMTCIEFANHKIDLKNPNSNKWAYITPDMIERMSKRIDLAFDYQEYDYRDCIRKEKEIQDIFMCLNLLECGNISILYRDNLRNWYMESFSHPEIEKSFSKIYSDPYLLFERIELQRTIKNFFVRNKFKLTEENQKRLYCWVNPFSLQTKHGANRITAKEEYLADSFKEIIIESHSQDLET